MFYIDQLCTTSFPIGLVKAKSDFIVRSFETDLGRWMLVVAVLINVDAYPFLAFSDLTCHLGDRNRCFLVALSHLIVKDTKLGSSNQEASLSAGKNTRVSLVQCSCIEVHPYSYLWWYGYFWGVWMSFVLTYEFSVKVTKITTRIHVS